MPRHCCTLTCVPLMFQTSSAVDLSAQQHPAGCAMPASVCVYLAQDPRTMSRACVCHALPLPAGRPASAACGLRPQVLGLQLGPLASLTDMGSQLTATGELTQANGALPTQGVPAAILSRVRNAEPVQRLLHGGASFVQPNKTPVCLLELRRSTMVLMLCRRGCCRQSIGPRTAAVDSDSAD